jgi:CRP-like cAMP-binding protein
VALPRHQKLRQKASLAMRSGDFAAALRVYLDLERLEPEEAVWPERLAGVYHAQGRRGEELRCLRRSLELLIEQGRVLPAIATCKLILDVAPEDEETLDRLHWLYAEPGMQSPSAAGPPGRAPQASALPADPDAPLDELELTEVIPETRSVRLAARATSRAAEIPLDAGEIDLFDLDALELDLVDTVHAILPPSPSPAAPAPSRAPAPPPPRAGAQLARDELGRLPLFGSLDAAALQRLVSRVEVVQLSAGDVLFREGDPADTLFVVVDGAVVPIAEGPPRTRMAVLEQGEFFGEIGLVTDQPRTATIEALVDTRLLAIDRKLMWSLIRAQGEIATILLRFVRERLIDRTLRTHPLFAPLARAELPALPAQFRFLEVEDGAAILEQGQPSPGLFVLLAGALDVVDEAEADAELARLAPGAVFGAVSLIRAEPAAASVFADGKCWVLVLEAARLRRLVAGRPALEDELRAALAGDARPPSFV